MGASGKNARRPAWRLPSALTDSEGKTQQLQDVLNGVVAASAPGALLPSERELVEQYGVARATVTRAIEALESQGVVYRIPRKGTFVAEPKVSASPELTSFSQEMASLGKRATSIVLNSNVIEAGVEIGRRLAISQRAHVVRIERVRCADEQPVAIERVHLPAKRFPGLQDADLTSSSLYELLSTTYGCRLSYAEQRVLAMPLNRADAHLLNADVGLASFLIERVTTDDHDVAVSFGRSVFRGDRYDLHMRLEAGTRPAES